jgi:hypothetical protein
MTKINTMRLASLITAINVLVASGLPENMLVCLAKYPARMIFSSCLLLLTDPIANGDLPAS